MGSPVSKQKPRFWKEKYCSVYPGLSREHPGPGSKGIRRALAGAPSFLVVTQFWEGKIFLRVPGILPGAPGAGIQRNPMNSGQSSSALALARARGTGVFYASGPFQDFNPNNAAASRSKLKNQNSQIPSKPIPEASAHCEESEDSRDDTRN